MAVTNTCAKASGADTPVVLSIAGSDTSAGAGIQADLKTLSALGVYGATVVTALTAQNTQGVDGVWEVPAAFVERQIDAVVRDMPLRAIKLGMLGGVETLGLIARKLLALSNLPVVLDPVMVSTSGSPLLPPAGIETLRRELVPLARVLTPNLAEAAALLNCAEAKNLDQMRQQAQSLRELGASAVLLKGGHLNAGSAADVLVSEEGTEIYSAPRVATLNTHGSGCTLAAAIAAALAVGSPLPVAVREAKTYISGAITHADRLQVGRGRGPVYHFYQLNQNEISVARPTSDVKREQ